LLQGVLSLCATFGVTRVFEILQWTLAGREKGVGALFFLSLAPTSGLLGTLGLSFSRSVQWKDRGVALARLALLAAVWTSGVVLFVQTQLKVVYESVSAYNVTAGVGPFNGSYVPEYLQQYQETNTGYNLSVLPYSTLVTASNLVVNPMHSTSIDPVSCEDGMACEGFLISGGLMMTTPWPPTDHADYPVVVIKDVPSVQIDFVRGIHNDMFIDSEDCLVFGQAGFLIGFKFCLAKSQSTKGSLFAG
jgi:hypothetical protein